MSNSPAPGTPQTPVKAWVAGIGAFFVGFLGFWIADTDPFTAKEIGQGVLVGLIGSGVIGGGTWAAKNTAK